MFRKLAYLNFILVVLGLSLTAQADFDTVGVYDPTDEPHNNDVDQSGTFVSATGVAGPDNVIDLETFQALIGPAFESDAGGVVDGEAPGTINGEDILAHYGINQTKTLTITNNSGHIKSVGQGNLNRLPISGSSGFGKDDDPDTLFTIGTITGGAPGEIVTHFAFTVLDRDDRTITPTVTAEFSDGSTVTSTATMDGSQPSNDQDSFFGFSAPPGTGIVSVNFDLSNWSNMDDIGFITSAYSESPKEQASKPNPANEAEDVPYDVTLSWQPGEFADKHDVYLGTNFEDVNNADADSPLLVSPAQDANSYHAGRLEFGQRYFWRIDEINAPSDDAVFKGPLWSFTIEPYAISIPGDRINVTASSYEPDQGPENTINGSGLDDNDLHSKDTAAMWLTASDGSSPAWIQYDFGKPYKLFQMLVWNYNGESILSLYGFKDVSVEYSTDDANWTQVNDVSEFAQGLGTNGYAVGTLVDFDGVTAAYVRITANSNWGGGQFAQFGLSEVRFMQIPVYARQPSPENGATDAALGTVLGWKSGREAVEHNIYLSKDGQSVTDGTAFVTTTSQSSYNPLSLGLGGTYYWRIDEVNNADVEPIWVGDIWSFTTQEYLVVEGFESYNDITEGQEGSNLVYLTWIDGYDNPETNGSTIGYPTGASMETTIVHGGRQSAPIMYDNSNASSSTVTVSTSDLAVDRDWASVSPEFLSIWFYGDPNNTGTDRMFVKIDGSKTVYNGGLTQENWQQWLIDLTSLGINLSNVSTITIGFEKVDSTGGSGMIFLDDIQLYTPAVLEQ